MVALTEALGVEWAGRGVRVVGVAPSVSTVDMVKEALELGQVPTEDETLKLSYDSPASHSPRHVQRRAPMRRAAAVDEVAETVFYLASEEASYIVAETIRVDGGYVAYQLF